MSPPRTGPARSAPSAGARTGAGVESEVRVKDTADVHREVVRQHRLLQDWLSGALPDGNAAFAPFTAAHDPGFHLVDTEGALLPRATVLAAVRAAHGTVPGLVIGIDEVRLTASHGPLLVAAFTEVHTTAAGRTACTVSAVLRRAPAAPGGLSWLHVHETARRHRTRT